MTDGNFIRRYFNEKAAAAQSKLDAALLDAAGRFGTRLQDFTGLLDGGARIDAADSKTGNTPLHAAARAGRADLVQALLDRGADANSQNLAGRGPLLEAATSCDPATVGLLLDKGAEVNARDAGLKHGVFHFLIEPTEVARRQRDAAGRQARCLEILMAKGLVLERGERRKVRDEDHLLKVVPDIQAQLALCQAGLRGDWKTVEAMIAAGTPPDASAEFGGMTPLRQAATSGNLPMIEKLLAAGADPNLKQGPWMGSFDYVATPLQAAAHYGQRNAVTRLLEAGGDPALPIYTGEGRLLTFRQFVSEDMAELVNRFQANRAVTLPNDLSVAKPLQIRPKPMKNS